MDEKLIKQVHAEIYSSDPFNTCVRKLSFRSGVVIPEKATLYFEKSNIHLGFLKPEKQFLSLLAINPGMLAQCLQSVNVECDVKEVFLEWQRKFKALIIKGNTSTTITLTMDCRNLKRGYYQAQILFFLSSGIPLKVDIHWAVDLTGRLLEPEEEQHRLHKFSAKLFVKKGRVFLSPPKISLGKIYSFSKTTYVCHSPDTKYAYLVEGSTDRKYLMKNAGGKKFIYELSPGSHLGYYYFMSDKRVRINSFRDRTLYYDSILNILQKEVTLYDRLIIIIKRKHKEKVIIDSTPEWLKEKYCRDESNNFICELEIIPDVSNWGEYSGNIELIYKKQRIKIEITFMLIPNSLIPLSVKPQIDFSKVPLNDEDILEGSIPIVVVGRGNLQVSFGDPTIKHSGNIEDYSNENIRTIFFPVRINLREISKDKLNNLPLKLFFRSPFGDKQIFSTKMILRTPSWRRTIDNMIGFLNLYKGQIRKYKFQYIFEDSEKISRFEVEKVEASSDIQIENDLEQQLTNIFMIQNGKNIPFAQLRYIGNNEFFIEIKTELIEKRTLFNFSLKYSVFTEKRIINDRLQFLGEVHVAKMDIVVFPGKNTISQYYLKGEIQIENQSNDELAIFNYYSNIDDLKLSIYNRKFKLPLIIKAKEKIMLSYSFPRQLAKKQKCSIVFISNDGEKNELQLV